MKQSKKTKKTAKLDKPAFAKPETVQPAVTSDNPREFMLSFFDPKRRLPLGD